MTQIDAIIYSYKNKNLKKVVDALLENTASSITIHVFDQHPLERSKFFSDSRIVYTHIFWDIIQSPCEYRGSILDSTSADYILQISDDTVVSKDWDKDLIAFIDGRDISISGNSPIRLIAKDRFSLKAQNIHGASYMLTNYINRNFIFASKEVWNSFEYPYYLKYNGEEEMLSLELFLAGKGIFSAPSRTYEDLGLRTIESVYTPFSKDHNYNLVIDAIRTRGTSFMQFHNLAGAELLPLPYQTNDVAYNPYALNFQDIDARKFISKTKAIY